ncbi:hypothetical protein HYPSUDRAFT_151670 [Hypholoma sublateritium FD-334 SS-4]|uniref:Uncharacterized protein n=1 Tax=Hypholoma sublateritium (strain FD-334 SS-4) TaxID=945553 RepID=A0A0D2N9P2_HYPSF|nr:hypothetical protein HYPSUDRAFT_151670 [Hypholoma sublateritium FD-334 SS-4]
MYETQCDILGNNSFFESSYNLSASEPQPLDKEIRVEYHPTSNREAQHFIFEDYIDNVVQADPHPNKIPDPHIKGPEPVWHPFSSRLDFEIAELIQDTHMNSRQTDALLSLIRKCIDEPEAYTLQSSKDLKEIWTAARAKTIAFEKKTISIPYPRENSATNKEFEVWSRSLWDWCSEIVTDPTLANQLRWNAERVFKYSNKQEKFERCITEPWTADSWWEAQASASPLCIILYADKTQLSSFGTAKGYPVLARCANLPINLRNGSGIAGGRLVGWLPIVKEDTKETRKKSFVNLKRVVWHEGFKEVLKSIIQYAQTGIWQKCADDVLRWIYPIILILSADYEEQCYMALIRGTNSLHPCPVCLVQESDLSDLLIPPILRTTEDMMNALNEARKLPSKERDQKFKQYGLRDVENVFWSLRFTDVYSALCWDRLHAYHGGLFEHHLWRLFKEIIEHMGRESFSDVHFKVDSTPRWSGLNHFSTLIKTSDFKDGRKYEDISKVIVFASHNILNKDASPQGYLLLQLMRSYLELDMYASLTVHTESTISAGREEMKTYDRLLKRYSKDYPDKSWNFPKAHTHIHMFDDIEKKGVTRNFNSKPNESAHRPLKKFYMHHTNFKNIDSQILRLEENMVASMMIREAMDSMPDMHQEDNDNNDEREAGQESKDFDDIALQHAVLGSGLPPQSFAQLAKDNSADTAFRDLRKKVSKKLSTVLSEESGAQRQLRIRPYQSLKVFFESMADWSIQSDILRAHPNFHHRPRYDHIILQAHKDDYVFAQLLKLFSIAVNEQTFNLALVLPLDGKIPLLNRGRDQDLRFTRIISRPRSASVVIDIDTIVRGALVVKDHGAELPNSHIVLDVIDSDFWLRMKSIKLAHNVNFG